jgi:hypothetical protein
LVFLLVGPWQVEAAADPGLPGELPPPDPPALLAPDGEILFLCQRNTAKKHSKGQKVRIYLLTLHGGDVNGNTINSRSMLMLLTDLDDFKNQLSSKSTPQIP